MIVPKKTELAERIKIHELAVAGYTDEQIAKELNLSVWTARKWRRRYRDQGRPGLQSKMGRPKQGCLSSFPVELRETLLAWRQAHPSWGAKTMRAELEQAEAFKNKRLPSWRSINDFFKEQELTRPHQRHSDLPQSNSTAPQTVHEEWELDARGHEAVPDVGLIMLININDCYSHTRLMSYPCWVGQQRLSRRPTTGDYQLVLRLTFAQWGLPERLAVDHDRIFYDGKSKSPFPTRFHLWLLALGVALNFGRFHCPTDQAITERSHQLWYSQVLDGQQFVDWHHLYLALHQRRDFLNTKLPCASLGELPPLVAHPQARTPRRPYRPEWETDLLDLAHLYNYLAQGRWFRLVSKDGTVSIGGQIYYLHHSWAKQQTEITFDPADQHLLFHSSDAQLIKRLPIQGLTKQALIGEMGPLVDLPAFQLALPFSWPEWRTAQLSRLLTGTT